MLYSSVTLSNNQAVPRTTRVVSNPCSTNISIFLVKGYTSIVDIPDIGIPNSRLLTLGSFCL